jgi:lipopolysaccharide/colanic/teichoic acid biosynthesis glycosyltransferase
MEDLNLKMDRHVLCVSTTENITWLSDAFPKLERIPLREALNQLALIDSERPPVAVLFVTAEVSDRFFKMVNATVQLLKPLDIPLIVLNDHLDEEGQLKVIQLGADDCYIKEVQSKELVYRIDFLTMLKKLLRENTALPIQPYNFKVSPSKRAFDILASSGALLVLSPIMILIALSIKIGSKGPIFYISKRAGTGYKVFNFLKFRTMRVGADAELAKLKHLNQYNQGENGNGSVFFKIENDPRITRLGRFLRNTSLDELPQLINVLKGDMSIVGNRPLPLYEAQQLTKDQSAMRFMAASGITGLWQVSKRGRKELSEDERIALDIEYAKSNSFQKDIVLIVRTLPALSQDISV